MSAVKSKNTGPEKILGKSMWRLGLRYKKHYKITGRPDFVFVKAKVAVFCDGDFWHGNNWKIRGLKSLGEELKRYNKFWRDKIRRNVARDYKVNNTLTSEGWLVLRFWESEIRKSPTKCVNKILKVVQKRS